MLMWRVVKVVVLSVLVLVPAALATGVGVGHPPIVVAGDDPKVGGMGCG